jgi:exodeoxyribonuclease VII large subunit
MSRQRVTRAGAQIGSFDLRARAKVLRRNIEHQRGALAAALARAVRLKHARFADTRVKLARFDLRSRVTLFRRAFEKSSEALRVRMDRLLVAKRRRFDAIELQRSERNPLRLLERGYAIVYDASGKVLRSMDQVSVGDDVAIRLAKGEVGATVHRKRQI